MSLWGGELSKVSLGVGWSCHAEGGEGVQSHFLDVEFIDDMLTRMDS